MVNFPGKEKYDGNDLRAVVEILRGEDGCPWDKVQTWKNVPSCARPSTGMTRT